jgi:hypothetical protein
VFDGETSDPAASLSKIVTVIDENCPNTALMGSSGPMTKLKVLCHADFSLHLTVTVNTTSFEFGKNLNISDFGS